MITLIDQAEYLNSEHGSGISRVQRSGQKNKPMTHIISYRFFALFYSLFISIFFAVSGCVMNDQKSSPAPVIEQNDQLEREHKELTEKLKREKQLNARLQMSLLEKHAEVNKLMLKNEHLVRAFVRNKVKLQNRGNKVEAVRLLAEVTTVIDTARATNPGGSWNEVLDRAERYLMESKAEIDKGDLENFFYLVSKAFEQVQMIELENREDGQQFDEPEMIFLVPLSMKLLLTSNVRIAPSPEAKIEFVLKAGSRVTAIGYKGMWVKVTINQQGDGWIHYSLLDAAEE